MATIKKAKKAQSGASVRDKMMTDINKSVKNPPSAKQVAAEKAKQDSTEKANRPIWLGGVHTAGYRAESEKQKNGGKTKAKSGAKVAKKGCMSCGGKMKKK